MSVAGLFVHFGLKSVFDVSIKEVFDWIDSRFADSSRRMPRAVFLANQRAWHVVGLALADESFGSWVRDAIRDGDLKAAREQIRAVIESTPNGLDLSPAELRTRSANELDRLRRAKAGNAADPATFDGAMASLQRFADPAALVEEALRAAVTVPDELAPHAPHLATVFRLNPEDTALFDAMFRHFFRAIVARDGDLSRRLTHDQLRSVSTTLDTRTAGILDQFDVLFDDLGKWFAAADGKLDNIRAKLDKLLDERAVTTNVRDPLKVSVTNEKELAQLQQWRDDLRKMPPEFVESADWAKLGDALAAARMFAEAREAHQAAAKAAADRAVEAEAEFKAYRDACEQEAWDDALKALVRAAELDPDRFTPFPLKRYEPVGILGAGGFGTVIRCRQRLAKGREVAVKTFHAADLSRDVDEVFSEAHALSELVDPAIVKIITWEFADPAESRPYLVMEYFPGVSLAAHLKQHGQLSVTDFIAVARQVAEAMAVAHASNILHRDLKPGNVLLLHAEDRWEVRVIDFGLAVRFSAVQASVSTSIPHRTRRDQSFAGTLEYASPEQKGVIKDDIGPRSDVYSFGKTMLETLLGTSEPVSDDWELVPEAFRGPLKRVLEKCVIRDPARRHPGFEAIAAALSALDPAEKANRERLERAAEDKTRQADAERERVLAVEAARVAAERQEAERKKREQEAAERDRERTAAELRAREEVERKKREQDELEQRHRAEEEAKAERQHQTEEQLRREVEAKKLAEQWARTEEARRQTEAAERARKAHPPGQYHPGSVVKPEPSPQPEKPRPKWLVAPFDRGTAKTAQRHWAAYYGIPTAQTVVLGEAQAGLIGQLLGSRPKPVEMELAFIPPGTFHMGSETGEDNERPVRPVTLTRGFYMAVHPVTQAQWKAVMGPGSAESRFNGADRPVDHVSWVHSQVFCTKLADKLNGKGMIRLPTEAEWEYACRAGTTTEYHTGDGAESLAKTGWYKGNSGKQTHPVTRLAPNAWNLYDMHGNVWEWVNDWIAEYRQGHAEDPTGPATGLFRVLRGGSWAYSAKRCRSAERNWFEPTDGNCDNGDVESDDPSDPNDDIGFRVVLPLPVD